LIRVVLEIIGAIILIVFGLLFFLYLPTTFSEVSTDAIFIGAGALIFRKALLDRKKEKTQNQINQRKQKTTRAKTDRKEIR
jgi:hypothetical protein